MDQFWYAFLPLLVALDVIGLVPLFWALCHSLSPKERRHAATQATVTAFLITLGFLPLSRFVFQLMGLTLADVMVAGGAILFVLSIRELVLSEKPPQGHYANPGVVPLGVPLLAGPAVLTAVLLVRDRYGWPVTLAALCVNMAVVWVVLRSSDWLIPRLGQEGAAIISKIANLILTAFGIMLMRQGITAYLPPPGVG
ncbi:MAG: MarC family protein [Candidatus Omnitrophica bacterium]|nr:MarC family protein [Candidatus Omnitrophota bacterium]MBI2174450.1 MarC family protein [Candidatus Omnitrophota bacterium]MBI3009938.1 MarC family protein [Candidatus Omnitrophota bacterium]